MEMMPDLSNTHGWYRPASYWWPKKMLRGQIHPGPLIPHSGGSHDEIVAHYRVDQFVTAFGELTRRGKTFGQCRLADRQKGTNARWQARKYPDLDDGEMVIKLRTGSNGPVTEVVVHEDHNLEEFLEICDESQPLLPDVDSEGFRREYFFRRTSFKIMVNHLNMEGFKTEDILLSALFDEGDNVYCKVYAQNNAELVLNSNDEWVYKDPEKVVIRQCLEEILRANDGTIPSDYQPMLASLLARRGYYYDQS